MKYFLIIIALFISNLIFSQKYMDEIAQESCKCIEKVADTLELNRRQMEIGFCMIEAASPYKKKLKKDYGIDFDYIDEHAEELGRIIGLRMASFCPDAIMNVANSVNEGPPLEDLSENITTGKVIAIKDNLFVEFSIRDEQGKIAKFYWLTFVESDIQLSMEYRSLKDQNIQVHYSTQEFFDARINEYRTFNIIEKIIVIE